MSKETDKVGKTDTEVAATSLLRVQAYAECKKWDQSTQRALLYKDSKAATRGMG